MKRLLFIVNFLVLFVFLTITNVNAKECTTTELRELKNLAKKVEISYEPQLDEANNYYFAVSAYNLDKRFYLKLQDFEYVFYMSPNRELGSYTTGTNLKVEVYAASITNCNEQLLTKKTYKLPIYNKYFDSKDCIEKEKNTLCRKWYDTSKMTEEKFKELLNQNNKKQEGKNFFDNLLSIIKQYGLVALGIIVGVGGLIFVVIFIKNKKRTKIDL